MTTAEPDEQPRGIPPIAQVLMMNETSPKTSAVAPRRMNAQMGAPSTNANGYTAQRRPSVRVAYG